MLVFLLDQLRDERGLSWRQVAAQAGLEPSTLQRIVAGSTPNLHHFAALIEWLGVPADAVFRHRPDLDLTLNGGVEAVVQVKAPTETLSFEASGVTRAQVESLRTAIQAMLDAAQAGAERAS